jgi:2-alkyl-3-oxoalkanoate reductase
MPPRRPNAAGVTSFRHVENAARAEMGAVEADAGRVVNVADGEPAKAVVGLPGYVRLLGAPRRTVCWQARVVPYTGRPSEPRLAPARTGPHRPGTRSAAGRSPPRVAYRGAAGA